MKAEDRVQEPRNLFKIERDNEGVAKLDTPKRRLIFTIVFITSFLFAAFSFVSFLWLFYWIITGRNIFVDI